MNTKHRSACIFRLMLALTILIGVLHFSARPALAAWQLDIHGPAGSGQFGAKVAVLPNGNIVVTDPHYNGGIGVDVGAVYLYNGATGALISMLTGMTPGDAVGSGGVTVLSNGNYVVSSPYWDNASAAEAGAVTWGNGTSGVTGPVSSANSLVGSTADDRVGSGGVTALSNGNYVVRSIYWDNTSATDAGAVTWGNGMSGVTGPVSSANSLVGSTADDQIGANGVTVLSDGNYVVRSPYWSNASAVEAGAVTWGNGTSGVTGPVSSANSLVGSKANDQIGANGVTVLSDGNYVVRSPYWDNAAQADAGAATWGNGMSGVSGVVTTTNSLVGSKADDQVSSGGVTALSNGNYVVSSPYWDNASVANVGAVTRGNGTSGVTGPVSSANSLVGSKADDYVGLGGVTALSNGNYVVRSPYWSNTADGMVGAVTWENGTSGVSGVVSAANSLVGSTAGDQVSSSGVTALSNGNYVVSSPYWDNAAKADAGAATWGNGTSGVSGVVTTTNSLVGSKADDQVSSGGVTALSNGNYVVSSPYWDKPIKANVGAVTWGNGTSGVSDAVSAANSLVGSTADDQVGNGGVIALSNGNYVVSSPYWDNASAAEAGAATWGNGMSGVTGPISAANSLVGSTANDAVSADGVVVLSNGNYVVCSPVWDNASIVDAGAVTWGNGTSGISGAVSVANSLVGSTADDYLGATNYRVTALSNGDYVVPSPYWDNAAVVDAGAVTWGFGLSGVAGPVDGNNSVQGTNANGGQYLVFQYDAFNRQLVVGRPADNIVTLFKLPYVFLPMLRR